MKTVLVPTDFSAYATVGINVASTIASKTDCPIVLHHNVISMVNWEGISESERLDHPHIYAKTVEAKRKLNDLISRDIDSDLQVNGVITHGITYEEIVLKARQLHADLIIMGSHGNEGPDRYFIGSNIQRVIREATCPVLAAKHEFQKKEIKKILFPFTFDEDVHKPFGEVKKFAAAMGATIYLLYVNSLEKFKDTMKIENEMNAFCERHPDQKFIKAVHSQSDPVAGIREYYKEIEADMIAVITHDRQHTAKYLVGTTELLVFHTDIPVLSVNSKPFEPVLL